MEKVIKNTLRGLNVALMNEPAIIVNEKANMLVALEAVGTKWSFLPFRPGLVGGFALETYKPDMLGYHPKVILRVGASTTAWASS